MTSSTIPPHILESLEPHLPGISSYLTSLSTSTSDVSCRAMLRILSHTPEFNANMAGLPEILRTSITEFMNGKSLAEVSKGFRQPLVAGVPGGGGSVVTSVKIDGKDVEVKEGDGSAVKAINLPFSNWASTIHNSPMYTFFPTTISGLSSTILAAGTLNRRIRVSSFRQSWSNIFSQDSHILVSLVPLEVATGLSEDIAADAGSARETEFNTIVWAGEEQGGKRNVKVGAGVSNENLRRWMVNEGWTVTSNVIAVENSIAGCTAPICHGSGVANKTLSDFITEVYYMDAHGQHRHITDAAQIKAAAGGLGVYGVLTHIVISLIPMRYAICAPAKMELSHAIPPPVGYAMPAPLARGWDESMRAEAEKRFKEDATKWYCEWFWFPYRSLIWVNCWDTTTDATGAVESPDEAGIWLQCVLNLTDHWLNSDKSFHALSGRDQGIINGSNMFFRSPPCLDGSGALKTQLPNAIHYRRGTHNFPIIDSECSMPLPTLASGEPDWELARRAYWDAVKICYEDEHASGAVRIGVEMRVIGESGLTMGPQRGNTKGTASIEIVSTPVAGWERKGEEGTGGVWRGVVQRIVEGWMKLEGTEGGRINTRVHWAKDWEHYTVEGRSIKDHVKEVSYKKEIPEFRGILEKIGVEHGWTIGEAKERFSNELWDEIIFG